MSERGNAASRGENLLFKISTFMVLTKISVVAVLGLMMVDKWHTANITAMPAAALEMQRNVIESSVRRLGKLAAAD